VKNAKETLTAFLFRLGKLLGDKSFKFMLVRISGKPKIEWMPKTASTLLYQNSLVQFSSGKLIAGTATSTAHAGLIQRTVAATDADYASATLVPVDVPDTNDIFEADVKPGVTAAATSVGAECDIYVGNGTTGTLGEHYVDTGTNSHHQVVIVGFISTSKVLVKISSMNSFNNPAAA
jgi:hypothetical protein